MIIPSNSKAFLASHTNTLKFNSLAKLSNSNLLAEVDLLRAVASLKLKQGKKGLMGQFLTPASVAELMAGMFDSLDLPEISLLDAGAGIGSLIAAFVAKVCQQKHTLSLRVVAYEIDPLLIRYLQQTLKLCEKECQHVGISFNYEIRETDFIEDAARLLEAGLLNGAIAAEFTHAILNPPYLKINAHSQVRELLRSIGLETSNLYTGFMAATAKLRWFPCGFDKFWSIYLLICICLSHSTIKGISSIRSELIFTSTSLIDAPRNSPLGCLHITCNQPVISQKFFDCLILYSSSF